MKILSFNYVKKNINKFWGAKISPQVAKKQELNITKLFIANEVDILIRKYVKERNDKIFEYLCSLVYEYYLMIYYSSIHDVANVICDLYFKNEKISEKNIREKLENMYLWKKWFMGLAKTSTHDLLSLGALRQFSYIGVRRLYKM